MAFPFPPFPVPPFPEIPLPGFLRPLLLVPIAQRRVAETLKSWLDGRHDQIFGPLEQAVAAVVILGLAMQGPPVFWVASSRAIPQQSFDSQKNSSQHTTAASNSPTSLDLPFVSLSSMYDHLKHLVEEHLPSPLTVALIVMVLNLALMLIPVDIKTRLKASWDLFWPPWQDRSSLTPPSGEPTESEKARKKKAESSLANEMSDANEAKLRERAKRQEMERAREKPKAEGTDHARNEEGKAHKPPRDQEEIGPDDKEKLKAKQRERLKEAEKARERGEGLTKEEKAKLLARREKAKAVEKDEKAQEPLGPRPKDGAGASGDEDKATQTATEEKKEARVLQKQKLRAIASLEQQVGRVSTTDTKAGPKKGTSDAANEEMNKRSKNREDTAGEAVPQTGSEASRGDDDKLIYRARKVGTEDSLVKRRSGPDATAEGLSRSERARRAKRIEAGGIEPSSPLVSSKEKGKGRMAGERPSDSARFMKSLSTTTTGLSDPATGLTPSERAQAAKDPTKLDPMEKQNSGGKYAIDDGASSADDASATSGEEDALMAGDYRPLKSALKKSKKKPRQRKNIHHNYFLTMRGYQPHLIPFPHGFHPKPHYPRHTLWYDNVPKNVDHVMAPPPVPKKPEEDEEEEKVLRKTVTEENSESEADGEGGTKSRAEKKTTVTEERVPLSKEEKEPRREVSKGSPSGGSEREGDRPKDKMARREETNKPKSSSSSGDRGPDQEEKAKAAAMAKAKVQAKDGANEKEKEKARLKAEAEAKDKARAEAKMEAAKLKAAAVPLPPPKEPTVDPQLKKATFVAQGLLCCLIYMVNEQLALLLLAFFAYTYMQQQALSTGTIPVDIPKTSKFTATSASSTSFELRDPPFPKAKPASPPQKDEVPDGMKEEFDQVKAAKAAEERASIPTISAKPELKAKRLDDLTPEQREMYEKAPLAKTKPASAASPSDVRDEKRGVQPESEGLRTIADLSPEQEEKYVRALGARKAKQTEESSPCSIAATQSGPGDILPTESNKQQQEEKKRPRRLEDMSNEQREAYMEARSRRKEKERLAERAENMSGLTINEKEALSYPSSPS